MDDRFLIRPADPGDVPAISALERVCFSDPWNSSGLLDVVQSETSFGLVGLDSGQVIGYIMARLSGEEGEILNLAVAPGYRRRGLATALLRAGLVRMFDSGAVEAYLEVRESNSAAIGLYQEHGFRPVGLRPDYYRNPREAALVLRCGLPGVRDSGSGSVSSVDRST